MTGRQEDQIKMETQVRKIVDKAPKIIKSYSYSFGENTTYTKIKYIKYVIEYIKYLEETGYNVDDVTIFSHMKPSDINEYFEEKVKYRMKDEEIVENGKSIRATKLYAIKNFYNFLLDEGYVSTNPCNNIKAPKLKEEKEVVYLTKEEVDEIKKNIMNVDDKMFAGGEKYRNRDMLIFTLGIRTGLRVTALTEINISDIDFENKRIWVVEKGDKRKFINIGDNTIILINKWIEDRKNLMKGFKNNDALFISKNRTRISTVGVNNLLNKYCSTLDKHISPHKMRSTFAVNLLDKTDNDIFLVQNMLGHVNIATTQRYVTLKDKRISKAVNIMDDF